MDSTVHIWTTSYGSRNPFSQNVFMHFFLKAFRSKENLMRNLGFTKFIPFQTLFSRTSATTQNVYTYQYRNTKHVGIYRSVMQILIPSPTFRIMDFRNATLVGGFEVFRLANQRNNSAVKPPNLAIAPFLFNDIWRQRRGCIYVRTLN